MRNNYRSAIGVVTGLVMSASPALGLPTMVRLGYNNCASCHISPQGGGLLNLYGRSIDQAQSMVGGEYGPWQNPFTDFINWGGRVTQDVRTVMQQQDTSTDNKAGSQVFRSRFLYRNATEPGKGFPITVTMTGENTSAPRPTLAYDPPRPSPSPTPPSAPSPSASTWKPTAIPGANPTSVPPSVPSTPKPSASASTSPPPFASATSPATSTSTPPGPPAVTSRSPPTAGTLAPIASAPSSPLPPPLSPKSSPFATLRPTPSPPSNPSAIFCVSRTTVTPGSASSSGSSPLSVLPPPTTPHATTPSSRSPDPPAAAKPPLLASSAPSSTPPKLPITFTPSNEAAGGRIARDNHVIFIDGVTRLARRPAKIHGEMLNVSRPIVITLNEPDAAGRLASRVLPIELPPLATPLTQDELRRQFETLRPAVVAAILSLLSTALRRLPGLPAPAASRFPEATHWAAGALEAINEKDLVCVTQPKNQFEAALIALIERSEGVWTGTATDLVRELSANLTPRALSQKLKESNP